MKKIISIIILLMSVFSVSAQDEYQGFKGFVDFYGGIYPGKGQNMEGFDLYDIKPLVTFGMNITEGYQIDKNFFVGIGIGGYAIIDNVDFDHWNDREIKNILFPVYVDGRWTLDLGRKITPFVDFKIGYQLSVATSGYSYDYYELIPYQDYSRSYHGYSYSFRVTHPGGVYVLPTVGVRFGSKTAFNLGISYNCTLPVELLCCDWEKSELSEYKSCKKWKASSLMLTLGIDF